MPSEVEAGPATDELEEMNASALPPQLEETPENVTLTKEKIHAIHRFLGRSTTTSETGFCFTAPNLARHLYGII